VSGTILTSVSNIASVALGFLVSVSIARHYGASTTGLLATVSSTIVLTAMLGGCGTDVLVVGDEGGGQSERCKLYICCHCCPANF